MEAKTKIEEKLYDTVLHIASAIRDAGGRALMVGGAVRDMILGAEAKDIDLEVYGLAPDRLISVLERDFALDLVGISFGVLKVHGCDIDIALPRRESKRGIGHKGFEIFSDPFLPIEDAAARRDFTINAIYLDPLTDEIIDPHNGYEDLKHGRLRHVSDHFTEDPLRVLRGMQFIARFNLDAAPETIDICRTMTPEDLPPERLMEEWAKLLTKGKAISKGLTFLKETGWVKYYPELEALINCEQDPKWHPEGSVWNHTLLALNAFAAARTGDRTEDLIVGLAVLCHDFGKPATTALDRGHIRSLGHDEAGIQPTLTFLSRLTASDDILKSVPPLVAAHMQPFALCTAKAGDNAVRRLAVKVGRIDRLIRVCRSDYKGCQGVDEENSNVEPTLKWLEEAAERLRIIDSRPKPILQGRDLIKLGYKPNAQFGIWLKAAYEAQLDGIFTDLEGAIDYFRISIADAKSEK